MNNPDRRDAILQARNILAAAPVIFDTETTGLDSDAEIIEISCITAHGSVLLDTLVKPTTSVPEDATRIHGLCDADLVAAPTILELEPRIKALFDHRTVGSYNLAYDTRLVGQSLHKARGGRPADRDWDDSNFCIMELYAQFWGDWHDYHGSYTWQALGNALDQCGITIEGPLHRVLADARGALAVLQYVAAAGTEALR